MPNFKPAPLGVFSVWWCDLSPRQPKYRQCRLLSILGFHFSDHLTAISAAFFHFSSLFRKIAIDNKTNKTVFPYSFYSVFSLYTLFLCLIVYIYLKNIVIPTVCGIDNDYRQYIDNGCSLSILRHALASLAHTLLTGSLWLFWFLGWVWD